MQSHFAGCELSAGHERCLCDARRYLIGIALSGAIVGVYLLGAWLSESLTLFSEGGHALVDAVIAYGWGIFITYRVYRRPEMEPRLRRQGSILNGIFFMVVGATIVVEVFRQDAYHIDNKVLAIASVLGVVLNMAQYWVIAYGDEHDTNRQLNLHNLGDIFQGLAVIVTSIVIALTGWEPIDRIVAAAMAVWFLRQGARMTFSQSSLGCNHSHHYH